VEDEVDLVVGMSPVAAEFASAWSAKGGFADCVVVCWTVVVMACVVVDGEATGLEEPPQPAAAPAQSATRAGTASLLTIPCRCARTRASLHAVRLLMNAA